MTAVFVKTLLICGLLQFLLFLGYVTTEQEQSMTQEVREKVQGRITAIAGGLILVAVAAIAGIIITW